MSDTTAEVFSFSGDVAWGSHFLRNLTQAISLGKLICPVGTLERVKEFCGLLCSSPPKGAACGLEVCYGARFENSTLSEFRLYLLTRSNEGSASWEVQRIGVNELASAKSTLVYTGDLGGSTFEQRQRWISRGDQGNVARTCFWSLCDLVDGLPGKDIMTGGFPQVAKLDASGPASPVGVKYNGIPTVFGGIVTNPSHRASFWVDHTFTALDPMTLEVFSNAQRYGRPKKGR